MLKRGANQEDPENSTDYRWRMFSSHLIILALPFVAMPRGNLEQKKQPHLRPDGVRGLIDTETSINE
jgi:hypothetical protein